MQLQRPSSRKPQVFAHRGSSSASASSASASSASASGAPDYPLPWRLLIVGCGDVGLRLIQRLRAVRGPAQLSILATARRTAQCEAIRQAGATPLLANLDQPGDVARLAALGQHAVILAPPGEGGVRDHRSRRLVAAWAAATRSYPAPRPAFVYLSTTGVYGDCSGAWVDECSPARPQHDRSRRRWDAEEQWRSRLGAVRLRVPGIYAGDRLPLARIAQGLPCLDPGEDSYSNHIHAEDLAQLAWLALFRAGPGRLYTVADDEPLPMGQWFDAVAAAFGMPAVPRLPRAQAQLRVSPMMWSFMTESRRLRNSRMHRELRPRLIAPRARDYLLSIHGAQLHSIHPQAPGLQSSR